MLSLSAVVGGFAEAGVLVLIARAAVALASKGAHDHVDISGTRVSLGLLIGIAAVLVAIRTALGVWQAGVSTH